MTIKEIAQLAGVSVSTVSKVMNNKDSSISAETRERVLRQQNSLTMFRMPARHG